MSAAYGAAVELPKAIPVAVGGVVGAVGRWALLDAADNALWMLILINTAGAFLLGAIVHGALRLGLDRRRLLGVGFCGAFTTLSTLALAIAQRLDDGRLLDAAAVVGSSVLLGLAAAFLGASSRRWATR